MALKLRAQGNVAALGSLRHTRVPPTLQRERARSRVVSAFGGGGATDRPARAAVPGPGGAARSASDGSVPKLASPARGTSTKFSTQERTYRYSCSGTSTKFSTQEPGTGS
eukprot:SAG31_NODE_3963_length_3716_cov_3.038430_5_plen_110_part_00